MNFISTHTINKHHKYVVISSISLKIVVTSLLFSPCEVKIPFIITRKEIQSFILTEVRDCDLLIVVTSFTFVKRKEMLKEKSS